MAKQLTNLWADHHHSFRYDEQERRKRQNPEEIFKQLGLKPGMCFIDLGSNDGFFSIPAARQVGPEGRVIALDVNQQAIERLKVKAQLAHLDNITTFVSQAEDKILCSSCADIIFLGTVLHDFQDPLKVLKNAQQMLKPSGVIYNLDWHKKETKIGPPLVIRLSTQEVTSLSAKAGLSCQIIDFDSDDYYLMALTRKKD